VPGPRLRVWKLEPIITASGNGNSANTSENKSETNRPSDLISGALSVTNHLDPNHDDDQFLLQN
jgi:hypothetical protein